jgi:hypothetical protein
MEIANFSVFFNKSSIFSGIFNFLCIEPLLFENCHRECSKWSQNLQNRSKNEAIMTGKFQYRHLRWDYFDPFFEKSVRNPKIDPSDPPKMKTNEIFNFSRNPFFENFSPLNAIPKSTFCEIVYNTLVFEKGVKTGKNRSKITKKIEIWGRKISNTPKMREKYLGPLDPTRIFDQNGPKIDFFDPFSMNFSSIFRI